MQQLEKKSNSCPLDPPEFAYVLWSPSYPHLPKKEENQLMSLKLPVIK